MESPTPQFFPAGALGRGRCAAFFLLPWLLVVWTAGAAPAPFSDEVGRQIQELQAEKAGRTPAQQKMESQLVYAVKRQRKTPFSARMEKVLQKTVKVEADGAALVDITANVTPELVAALKTAGATGIVSVPRFRAIRARIPLAAMEQVAARPEVGFIKKAVLAFTHTGPIDSEGDIAHGTGGATGARAVSNVSGAGVKVGVLSDSVDYLGNSQLSGELGPVTLVDGFTGETGEGTAMLEIVHDIAPSAQLFFATAYRSEASFAQNILNLRAAGCDIIVDDVGYFDESPFQNGPIAEAIEQVTADGALCFSAAGNEGNKDRGTSGTWEGDFVDGGATTSPITKAGRLHSFGGLNYNVVTSTGFGETLFWTDPLGASTNDYDLYVLSADGTSIVAFSNTTQNGTQDPVEVIPQQDQPIAAGQRLIVVKAAGAAARFLQISTLRGTLTTSTSGKIAGHSGCPSVLSVAAVSAASGTAFNTSSRVESFSSDGPRRVFYNTDGTPITPGNLSATGGRVLQKPDIAAADGVSTSVPGFLPFYGTSAAAPHAGAIAALLKSQDLKMTQAQLRAALLANTIDIEGPGVDRDTGAGILRPAPTLLGITAGAKIGQVSLTITGESYTPANGAPDPGERVTVALALRNSGGTAPGNLTATLLSTGGVSNPTAAQTYTLPPGATDTHSFSLTANAISGGKLTLTFAIADGATVYPSITQVFTLGVPGTVKTFSNATKIIINDYDGGATSVGATPFPSNINVTGLTGGVAKVTVRLNGFTHTFPSDVRVMLVSPAGTSVMLMADAGGGTPATGTNLTFDDAGSVTFTPSVTGTYHPNDNTGSGLYGDEPFPAPAPSGAYATEMGAFAGASANGVWSLYVADDGQGDVGTINGGWTLNITPVTYGSPPTPGADLAVTMTASTNVVASGQEIDYTITIANNGTADATNVQFSDSFPAGLTPIGGTITQGSGSIDGNAVTASLGTIPAKGFATVFLQATADGAGNLPNTASVTTATTEIDLTNNSATLGAFAGLPNLTLVQPPGWSDRLVASSVPGTNVDSGAATDPLFLDFAIGNTGTAPANAYFSTKLFVDDVLMRTFSRQLALPAGGVARIEDIPLPALSAGSHTLRVQVDSDNSVVESDETDNEYTRIIGFVAPTLAAFAPAQILEDANQARIPIAAGLTGIAPGNPTFTAASNNSGLIPNENITFGSDADGSFLTITPLADANGVAVITVTVKASDGQKASADLNLTVLSVNDAPTLAALPALNLLEDAGPQTVPLAGITAGGGESQALTVTAVSDNPTLTPNLQVAYNSPDDHGSLNFTPQANGYGVAHITVTVTDNGGTGNGGVDHTAQTFTVTVAPVNDPPTFVKGADLNVLEDAGAQVMAGWATQISAGAGAESDQTVDFLVSTNNPGLFATAPTIAADGTLNFTPAPDANGNAIVSVRLHDNGGTDNGGTDTSAEQQFTIVVKPVNDAPSFIAGASQAVLQNAGARVITPWATQISAGPADEQGQSLTFLVSVDQPALFSSQPVISTNGTLAYTPAGNMSGTAQITVRLQDNGGGDDGGADTSAPQVFAIAITAVNDAPSFTKGANQSSAQDAGPQTVAGWAKNIKAGPEDEVGQVLDFRVTTQDATLFTTPPAISPDGTLTYTPAPTASGTTTVTVILHDNGGTDNGGSDVSAPQTFTIAVTTFIEEIGTYNGLITAPDGQPQTHLSAGLARVQILHSGAFSAAVRLGVRSYPVRGQFDKSGAATFGRTKLPSQTLKRTGLPDLELQLRLDVGGGSDQLTGTLTESDQPFAALVADRALYTTPKLAKAPYRAVPPEILGRYTVLLPAKAPGTVSLAATSYPQGDGVGSLVVDTRGRAILRIMLPDGTRLGYINSLSKTNSFPLYLPLVRGTGSLSGITTFRDRTTVSDFDALDLNWFKPASRAAHYPLGWMSGLQIDLIGSKYVPKAGRSTLDPLAVPSRTGNAAVTLTGGSLTSPGLLHPLNIDQRDVAKSLVGETNPLSMRLVRSTGQIGGYFRDPVTRRLLAYHGAVFQKQEMASGFFLDTTQSGAFVLTPQGPPAPEPTQPTP